LANATHTVRRELEVDVARVFDVVVAEDVLPRVLHRWGPIPAVSGTRDLTGPWHTPGSERTVVLADGSTARERVIAWERPEQFEYRVDRFTNPLGRMVDHALGTWSFSPTDSGSRFAWTYTFHARGLATAALLTVFVRTAWARYMGQCADLCVELASSEPGSG
jgi:polyketide cyclase/dehydrase/lipid transport protein